MMDYSKQVKEIATYFRKNEKDVKDFKMGIEFEHFIIDKETLKTINYFNENGVRDTLKELEALGWEGYYEGEYILGLSKDDKFITLEPGSQFEFSMKPQKDIMGIEKVYFEFLGQIIPILERKNQYLIAVGYHPETKIEDIKILPKQRYDYMFNYFKTKGSHAHNMMKGTASLQIAMDYKSEEDYVKKFRITNAFGPVMFALFDNAFYFEGEKWPKHNVRTLIWENCDNDRSGVVEGTFDPEFGYEKYAQYILNHPPIFVDDGKTLHFTGNKLAKEVFDPENYTEDELEHILTMVFPDVRTKKYVEIRMMDSIPYPLNLSVVALWKGVLYNEDNVEKAYDYVKGITEEDIQRAKQDIIEKGLDGKLKGETVYDRGNWLLEVAKTGLAEQERKYLQPLEDMLKMKKNPYAITQENQSLGKKEAIEWCTLNKLIEVE